MAKPSKKFSIEVRVFDSAADSTVESGSVLLVGKDGSVLQANLLNGVCKFNDLESPSWQCVLPYEIHNTSASGGRWDIPVCAIEVDPGQPNYAIDFTFNSQLAAVITDFDDAEISESYQGDVVKLVISAGPNWVLTPDDKDWASIGGGTYQRRFNNLGRYSGSTRIAVPAVVRDSSGTSILANTEGLHLVNIFDGSAKYTSPYLAEALQTRELPALTLNLAARLDVIEPQAKPVTARNFTVSHARKVIEPTVPMSFFVHLLNNSKSIEFGAYQQFMNSVLCGNGKPNLPDAHDKKINRLKGELTDFGIGAYELLKTATEAFLLIHGTSLTGTISDTLELGDYSHVSQSKWVDLLTPYLGSNRLPYINHIIASALPAYEVSGSDSRFCTDILVRSRINNPCFMELIWNYWHEEAMLVQTINAISRRFQNLRAPGERDPLAHVEIDPLRPLNNILWGYVEEERDRLSIKRRAYEYQHQYGLELYGKAVSNLRPADNRSKFLEAFHNLLNKCADYFRAKQDTTVDPDGYPMLHAIQELNLILAQGAHNQFGDLAWTSRVEMLMQEWILSRPEIRDFLQSRVMVPHKEAWMPQVDTMKTLQGWSDVPVTHFRDLGVLGEQILLTIRWHNWYEVTNEDEAKGWADLLRPHIQSYIHSYRAVTGVDLSATDNVDFTMPSVLLRKRLASQHAVR